MRRRTKWEKGNKTLRSKYEEEPIVYGNDPKEEYLKVSKPKFELDIKKVIFASLVLVLIVSALVYLLLNI